MALQRNLLFWQMCVAFYRAGRGNDRSTVHVFSVPQILRWWSSCCRTYTKRNEKAWKRWIGILLCASNLGICFVYFIFIFRLHMYSGVFSFVFFFSVSLVLFIVWLCHRIDLGFMSQMKHTLISLLLCCSVFSLRLFLSCTHMHAHMHTHICMHVHAHTHTHTHK